MNPRLQRRSGAVLFLLVALTLPGCRKQQPAPPPMGPMPVTVAKPIKHELVEWDRYLGRLEPVESVEVRSRVAGYLMAVHFTEGERVEKGAKLFSIDDRPLQAEAAQARAELARARAQLDVARAQKAQAQAGLTESEARKRQFDSILDLAEKRNERATRAVASSAIAEETVDVRKSEVQQAKANVEAASAEIESSKASIATAQASVVAAESSIAAAQSALDRAELELSYCLITAPISGRISRELVTVGNWVAGGSQQATTLTTIVSSDPVYCYFDANEQALMRYLRLDLAGKRESSRSVRNPVFLALVDEKGFPHRGYIDFIDNRVDAETGTIRARAILANPDGLLIPGLFATICVPGTAPHEAILIPDAAIVADQSDRFVWTIEADGSVGRRNVVLGPVAMGQRIIRSGLNGDERVIIKGLQRIRPGVPVQPTEEAIKLEERPDDLPNHYEPVPESEILPRPNPAERGEKR